MRSIWDQRIPTLLAMFLIVIGVGVTTYVLQQTTNLFGHAAPSESPQNIRITNITDTSFTVTYTTDAVVIGTLAVGSSNVQTVFDERDEASGIPKAYAIHSFTVAHLQAKTAYQFSILSGTTTFLNNGNPFSVTTFSGLKAQPSSQTPLAGKVLEPDGSTPQEALLYITTDNGQVLSTLVKSTGLYVLPLNTMRVKDGTSFLSLSPNTKLQLLASDGKNASQATVLVSGTNPVPAITLTQNYDFTIGITPLASSSGQESALPTFPVDVSLQATPKITSPNKDNESFTDQQPVFQGTGQPNETVKIEIHSDAAITTQVTTNASGQWSYRPTKPLSPGQHTITIVTADAAGIMHTVQRSFTVYAAGSQVNQSATPSATPTVKVPTATPAPTTKPTPTTTVLSATPVPAATATPVPTQTPVVLTPTKAVLPTGKIPVTGSDATSFIAGAGILTTIAGIILFILARGAVL